MLGSLARWLSILGYDTAYDNRIDDDEIIGRSGAEGRIALTRDTRLVHRLHRVPHLLVQGDDLVSQICQVLDYLGERIDSGQASHALCGVQYPTRAYSQAGRSGTSSFLCLSSSAPLQALPFLQTNLLGRHAPGTDSETRRIGRANEQTNKRAGEIKGQSAYFLFSCETKGNKQTVPLFPTVTYTIFFRLLRLFYERSEFAHHADPVRPRYTRHPARLR